MGIPPLIIYTLSCQWAQPYWQPSMSHWRECDVFCAVGLAGESGSTARVQRATGTAQGKVHSHCPEPYIERVATMGSQFLAGHVIHGRHFVSKCRHSYGTAIG